MTRPTKRASRGAVARARAASKPAGVAKSPADVPIDVPLLNPIDSIIADATARSKKTGYASFWKKLRELNHPVWPTLSGLRERFAAGEIQCGYVALFEALIARFPDLDWPKVGSFREFLRGGLL